MNESRSEKLRKAKQKHSQQIKQMKQIEAIAPNH